MKIIKESWTRNHDFSVPEKLRALKEELKKWNNNEFGFIEDHIEKCEEKIVFIDKIANTHLLCTYELQVRKEAKTELWTWLKRNESYWAQFSREKWIKKLRVQTVFISSSLKAHGK